MRNAPLKLLLCDSVIVIESFRLNLWKSLVNRFVVHITPAIMDESQFFADADLKKHYLDLRELIRNKIILIETPNIDEVQAVFRKAHELKLEIHLGEAQSLAVLGRSSINQFFCTADRGAVIISHALNIMDRVLSLEKCLTGQRAVNLPDFLSEKFMHRWKAEAIQKV